MRLRIRDDLHCVHSDFQFQVESYPYDPNLMVFMDYRDYTKQKVSCLEAEYPTFLYAMAMSPTRVFFEVCWMCISCLLNYLIHLQVI